MSALLDIQGLRGGYGRVEVLRGGARAGGGGELVGRGGSTRAGLPRMR